MSVNELSLFSTQPKVGTKESSATFKDLKLSQRGNWIVHNLINFKFKTPAPGHQTELHDENLISPDSLVDFCDILTHNPSEEKIFSIQDTADPDNRARDQQSFLSDCPHAGGWRSEKKKKWQEHYAKTRAAIRLGYAMSVKSIGGI